MLIAVVTTEMVILNGPGSFIIVIILVSFIGKVISVYINIIAGTA